MTDTSAGYDAVLVMDRYGNLWRHYGDVGYIRLITESKYMEPAARDLAVLRERTGGDLVEWVPST